MIVLIVFIYHCCDTVSVCHEDRASEASCRSGCLKNSTEVCMMCKHMYTYEFCQSEARADIYPFYPEEQTFILNQN